MTDEDLAKVKEYSGDVWLILTTINLVGKDMQENELSEVEISRPDYKGFNTVIRIKR